MDLNNLDVLKKRTNYNDLFFYQKSEVLYQMTFAFCDRFILLHGDRTRDQMIQAARSGKQNFVEGLADGETSTEMMLKLLNVGRASLQELQQDYHDYCMAHHLAIWDKSHARYATMLDYCRDHNKLEDYQQMFSLWNAEEYCNTAITLCRITDRMVSNFLKREEALFVKEGGIKERMHKARTGYRQAEDAELARLRQEVPALKAEIERLKALLKARGWQED